MPKIKIEVSVRHVHLSQRDLDKLFGRGYELKILKNLSQPGEYAAKETVAIKTKKGGFSKVRILGPVREETQVEISLTDSYVLGIKAPIRVSEGLAGTPGIRIIGPKGSVDIKRGVIVARRHIHATPGDASKYKLKDNQEVAVVVKSGKRRLEFGGVVVRVSKRYAWVCHVDTDEGNAAGIVNSIKGELIKI